MTVNGLTKECLVSSLRDVTAGNPIVWTLSGRIPTIGFYRALHFYLRQHSNSCTKTAIGKLYCAIDSHLNNKGGRPDNVYQFVERIVSSQHHSEEVMKYTSQQVKSMSKKLSECSKQLELLNLECAELKTSYEETKGQLKQSKTALRDITNQNSILLQKLKSSKEKISQLKCKNASLVEECVNFEVNLLEAADSDSDDSDDSVTNVTKPTIQSVIGASRRYAPEIRMLYYNLLAEQVPVSKINAIIRHVLKCFNPTENIEALELYSSYSKNEGIGSLVGGVVVCSLYEKRGTKNHL